MKLVLLLCITVAIALSPGLNRLQLATGIAIQAAAIVLAGLPLIPVLLRSLVVVPVVGPFVIILLLSGDPARAGVTLGKCYLSSAATLLTIATTPFPLLLSGAQALRMPTTLIEVLQILYRYLFVVMDEAQQMRVAFRARGGRVGRQAFVAAAGIVATLFAKSFQRAVAIHQAMLARGFDGTIRGRDLPALNLRNLSWLLCGAAASVCFYWIGR